MSEPVVAIDISALQWAIAHVSRIELAAGDAEQLLTELGAVGESQTRRRIEVEKTAPDGAPWKPNDTNTSILFASGRHLHDSIAFNASASEVEWGASWEWAHVHQKGMVIKPKDKKALAFYAPGGMYGVTHVFTKKVTIPARPFVGISADNATEITEHVSDFLGRLVAP